MGRPERTSSSEKTSRGLVAPSAGKLALLVGRTTAVVSGVEEDLLAMYCEAVMEKLRVRRIAGSMDRRSATCRHNPKTLREQQEARGVILKARQAE